MRHRLIVPSVVAAAALIAGAVSISAGRPSANITDPAVVDTTVVDTTLAVDPGGDPPVETTVPVIPLDGPPNEISDPGAESGWTAASGTPGSGLRRDETRAHTGLASFVLTAPATGGDVVLDDSPNWVPASLGSTCTASAWVAGTPGVTATIGLTATPLGAPSNVAVTPFVLPDAEWHQIEATLAVTPGTPVDLRISGLALVANDQLWIDDVTENCGQLQPPVARLVVNPATGVAPLTVTADASTSTDPNADISSYTFNWGDASAAESAATPSATHTYAAAGSYTLTVTVTDVGGLSNSASQPILVTTPPPPPGDPVIVAAGDIACANGAMSKSCASDRTAKLIGTIAPTRVFPLGDLQYGPTRTAAEFQGGYGPYPDPVAHPSWGDFKAITSPTIGSHEYDGFPTADGYFEYWNGSATADGPAGKPDQGYYAETIGTWRVFHLNSQKGYQAGSAQDQWFAAELAANPTKCSLVTWHHPRFSSGAHGDQTRVNGLFATAYAGGAEAVLSGNDHLYERFGPQNPSGAADATRGVVQFVVGSGGRSLYNWGSIKANSAFRNNTAYGVLSMTLHDGSYDWAYIAEDGTTLDSGTTNCTT